VRQVGGLLMLRASEMDITLEAPWAMAAQGTLTASWFQGPFEALLPLKREVQP